MSERKFQFTGTAGDYFGAAIVAFVCCLIPIFGWPIAFSSSASSARSSTPVWAATRASVQ